MIRDYVVSVDGEALEFEVETQMGGIRVWFDGSKHDISIQTRGDRLDLSTHGEVFLVTVKKGAEDIYHIEDAEGIHRVCVAKTRRIETQTSDQGLSRRFTVEAPIPGKVVSLNVEIGDRVEAGDVLLVLEAMKMQNEIRSPIQAEVKKVFAREESKVSSGDALVGLETT